MVGTIKKLLVASALAIGLVLGGGINGALALDKNHPIPDIQLQAQSYYTYVKVVAVGVAEGIYRKDFDIEKNEWIWDSRPVWFEQCGSGTVVNDQMILTAAHVVVPGDVSTPESGVSVYQSPAINLIYRQILIFDYKDEPTLGYVHWIDTARDVVLIRFVPKPKQLVPIQYDWVPDRNWLFEGDAITIVVHKRLPNGELDCDLQLVRGHITYNGPHHDNKFVISYLSPWDITTDAVIIPGDSGSPVFGYVNGVPVLIGVARAYAPADPHGYTFHFYFAYVDKDIKRYSQLLY